MRAIFVYLIVGLFVLGYIGGLAGARGKLDAMSPSFALWVVVGWPVVLGAMAYEAQE